MKALVIKELREVLWPTLALVVVLALVHLTTQQFHDLVLGPRRDPIVGAVITAAAAGMLFAFVQHHAERWFGTAAVLVHRGTGARGAFLAKSIVGAPAAWLVGFAPLLATACVHALGSNGTIVQWMRVAEHAVAACSAFAAYAIVAWVVQLGRGARSLFLVVTAAPCALLTIGELTTNVSTSVVGLAVTWLACLVVTTLAFGWLGLRRVSDPIDADLPLATRDLAPAVLLAPLLWLVFMGGLVAKLELGTLRAIRLDHPRAVLDARGTVAFAKRSSDGLWRAVDERGEPDPSRVLTTRDELEPDPSDPAPSSLFEIAGYDVSAHLAAKEELARRAERELALPWKRWTLFDLEYERYVGGGEVGSWARWCWIDLDAGVLRLIGVRVEPHFGREAIRVSTAPPFEKSFARGDGQRFGEPVLVATVHGKACIADLSDGTLWAANAVADRIDVGALELPATVAGRAWTVGRGEIVAGDTRVRFDGSALVPIVPIVAGYELERLPSDPLTLAARVVRTETRDSVLEASFEPSTARQRGLAFVAQACTLVRPPLAALVSFFGAPWEPAELGEASWLRDPLLAGRSRPLLFVFVLAISAACAALALRRQRRLGSAPSVVALATVLAAAFGPLALVWLAHLEPRSTPALAPREVDDGAIEPAIQTA